MQRILVCGGRDYKNKPAVFDNLRALCADHDGFACQLGHVIIHGACRGADTLASECVPLLNNTLCEWEEKPYPADWGKYGKAAGPIRNQKMIDEGKPDYALVFPGGSGTADMVQKLMKANIPFRYCGG